MVYPLGGVSCRTGVAISIAAGAAPDCATDCGAKVNFGGISGAGGATGATDGATAVAVAVVRGVGFGAFGMTTGARDGSGLLIAPLDETTGRPTRAEVVAPWLDDPGAGAFGQRLERLPL